MKNDGKSITDLTGQGNHTDKDNLTSNREQNVLTEIEKSKVHIIVEIIEYVPNAIVSKTIIRKTTGNITASSFAIGKELAEKTSPFDNYIQIIDGAAEVVIDNKKYELKLEVYTLHSDLMYIWKMAIS
jgi:hypothetical protein